MCLALRRSAIVDPMIGAAYAAFVLGPLILGVLFALFTLSEPAGSSTVRSGWICIVALYPVSLTILLFVYGIRGSPLHHAARTGRVQVANDLLASGSKADLRNVLRQTPLHTAVKHRHAAVASLLVASGANPSATDRYGRTPLDMARQMKNQEMIELFMADKGKRRQS